MIAAVALPVASAIADMAPIIFSAGGYQEGMSSGTGMSVVTTMGYSGILWRHRRSASSPSIGFGSVFVALSGLLIVVLLMAGLAHARRFAPSPGRRVFQLS